MKKLEDFKPYTVQGVIEVKVEVPVYWDGDIEIESWVIIAKVAELLENNIKFDWYPNASLEVVNTEDLEVVEGI